MNKNLPEYIGLKHGLIAGQAGARVAAGLSDRIGVLVIASAATVVTLQQHNAASAGTSKALSTDNISYLKLDANDVFTKTKPLPGVVGNSYTISAAGILYIEVESSQLDSNNGFGFFSVNTDVNAQAVYFLSDMRNVPSYNIAL